MSDTQRMRIIDALLARLATVRKRHGASSDAGRQVFVHETPILSEDDPDAIALVALEDDASWNGAKVAAWVPFEVQALGFAPVGRDAWKVAERLLGDCKRAIETPDRTLDGALQNPLQIERGSTRVLDRESGSHTVGVSVTYRVLVSECWGMP